MLKTIVWLEALVVKLEDLCRAPTSSPPHHPACLRDRRMKGILLKSLQHFSYSSVATPSAPKPVELLLSWLYGFNSLLPHRFVLLPTSTPETTKYLIASKEFSSSSQNY